MELEQIGLDNIGFSVITLAEVYHIGNDKQFKACKRFLDHFKRYDLSEEISDVFYGLIQSYRHRQGKEWISDALIAATAIHHGLALFSLNRKDFDFIEGISHQNATIWNK
jgi:predicted nucleic acid-binding protein